VRTGSSSYTVHGDVLVDPLENVWIERYHLPLEPIASWIILNTGGETMAEVWIPRSFRMLEVGADYVLGTWTAGRRCSSQSALSIRSRAPAATV